jgi:hypothetical protein
MQAMPSLSKSLQLKISRLGVRPAQVRLPHPANLRVPDTAPSNADVMQTLAEIKQNQQAIMDQLSKLQQGLHAIAHNMIADDTWIFYAISNHLLSDFASRDYLPGP